ncbi:response regulator [Pseudalkalibacillus sp. R45]|uniref:response regulator n=1 Tax=Pseudalkalibacillus sp. R45 TaxID=3457433 RepID=UPI003FCE575A
MNTKVVIIDDEAFVRRGIITSIPWQKHGIEIVGERSDGKSGLALIQEKKPEIVITDIRMPNMNGLDMIKVIRSEFPSIKILVLSVLEDFNTLREALRLGVDDYINKLTEPEELLERVLRLKKEIDGKRRSKNIGSKEDNLVLSDLEKWFSGDEVAQYRSFLQKNERYIVGKITDDDSSISNFLHQLIEAFSVELKVGESKIHDLIFIIKSLDELQLDKAIQHIKQQISKSSTIGISHAFNDVSERNIAFNQANQAIEYRFYDEKKHVFVYDKKLDFQSKRQSLFENSQLKEYLSLIESGEAEKSRQALERLFPEDPVVRVSPRVVRNDINQWLSANIALLRDWGGYLEGTLQNESPYEQIHQLKTYSELRQWCFRIHFVICEMLHTLKNSRERIEIPKAMDYIKKHYSRSIRVQDVARAVNLSENYFSYLFTKETGITFTQFIQETRISKAKELLRNPQYHWNEVGERVGFEDPKYFSKVFKKITGMTPSRFQHGS